MITLPYGSGPWAGAGDAHLLGRQGGRADRAGHASGRVVGDGRWVLDLADENPQLLDVYLHGLILLPARGPGRAADWTGADTRTGRQSG